MDRCESARYLHAIRGSGHLPQALGWLAHTSLVFQAQPSSHWSAFCKRANRKLLAFSYAVHGLGRPACWRFAPSLVRAAKIAPRCSLVGALVRRPHPFHFARALARWRSLRRTVLAAQWPGSEEKLAPNYSVKWTAANRYGIFMLIRGSGHLPQALGVIMQVIRRILVLVALSCFATLAFASEEGILAFGSFRIESPGIGESGPVAISGTQTPEGLQSLTVEAFGKKVVLSPAQLHDLSAASVNNVQLSYEAGYKELGGRTVYIQFAKGFTSGIVTRKFVVVTESGTVKVGATP